MRLLCRMAARAPYPAYKIDKITTMITRKISRCSKAASEDIPRSVVNYVTGVAKRSQRRYGAKDKA
ncbi:hypothetical protein ROD_38191 [Citrobacter rodentium ICC168]|uniref:Uncharacterized protein n=2 Tax=Citrobacter rodentium TaxID=67825 RepID=D2TU57_CITRI|nr:hypothetical protein ROD_38191 [Citrobacter rodentium ICC168]